MNPRWGKEAGLTLIELLVVLALLGLLGGLVAAGLHAASGSWQRLVLYDADNEELHGIEATLDRLISQIVPLRIADSTEGIVQFVGETYRLEFFAPLAERFGAKDIAVYEVGFGDKGILRIRWQLDRDSPSGRLSFSPAPIEESFEGVTVGEFAFFGLADDSQQAEWRSSWSGQRRLPQLVRLRFAWRGQPQELVIAPRLTAGPCSMRDSDLPCLN